LIELRRPWLVVALGASVALAGCGGGRGAAAPATHPDAPSVGVYQGRFVDAEDRGRRFKLLLFAALPDRIHAEVVSPLGRTEMILDGGGGRVAITMVPEGVSFVGESGPRSLERVLGVPLGLEALVRGLLTGETIGQGYSVVRSGSAAGGLPQRLEVRSGSAGLELRLKKVRPMTGGGPALGSGEPPADTELRSLEELESWQGGTPQKEGS